MPSPRKKRTLSPPAQFEANSRNPLDLDNTPAAKRPSVPAAPLTRAEERQAFLDSRPT